MGFLTAGVIRWPVFRALLSSFINLAGSRMTWSPARIPLFTTTSVAFECAQYHVAPLDASPRFFDRHLIPASECTDGPRRDGKHVVEVCDVDLNVYMPVREGAPAGACRIRFRMV